MTALKFFNNYIKNLFSTRKLESGSYNQATVVLKPVKIDDYEAYWLVKKPIRSNRLGFSSLNDPARAYRKWREINPDFPVFTYGNSLWTVPFLGHKRPTDEQISLAIVQIYQRTGNIIADGCNNQNFVLFEDEAVCVDMDLAIRRNSIVSNDYFNEVINHQTFDNFYDKFSHSGHTIEVIKTLFYIENFFPILQFDHTCVTPWLVQHLHDFRRWDFPLTAVQFNILRKLETLKDIYPELEELITFDVITQLKESDLSIEPSDLYQKIVTLNDNLLIQHSKNITNDLEILSKSRKLFENNHSPISAFDIESLDESMIFAMDMNEGLATSSVWASMKNVSPSSSIESDTTKESFLTPTSQLFSNPGSLESSPFFENRFFSHLNQRPNIKKGHQEIFDSYAFNRLR